MDQSEGFYNRSLRYLAIRPRSEKEIRDYLKKKKASDEVIDLVIERLASHKFIDDEEFVRWWVRQRTVNKPQSYSLTKRELLIKGVDKETIDEVFQEPDEERQDEYALAKKIVERKIGKYRNLDKKEIYEKLGGVLSRRGFSWEIIKRAIDDCSK